MDICNSCILHIGLLTLGLSLIVLGLVEFTTRRILNLTPDQESTTESIYYSTTTETYVTTTEVIYMHGGTIAFGIIFCIGGAIIW